MSSIGDDLARAYEDGYNNGFRDGMEKAHEQIDAAPTIDLVRHARWVEIPIESDAVEYADYVGFLAKTEMNTVFWECSACGSFDRGASSRPPKFCRGCGARMDAVALSKMEITTEEEKDE